MYHERLQALKHFLNQLPVKKPSLETLFILAELVVTLNCFSFFWGQLLHCRNKSTFLQWDPKWDLATPTFL